MQGSDPLPLRLYAVINKKPDHSIYQLAKEMGWSSGKVMSKDEYEKKRIQEPVSEEAKGGDMPTEPLSHKPDMRKDEHVERIPGDSMSKNAHDLSTKALAYILENFNQGREPTTADVAQHVGTESRPLGVALSKLGIKSKSTTHGGVGMRLYPLSVRAKIEEILGRR